MTAYSFPAGFYVACDFSCTALFFPTGVFSCEVRQPGLLILSTPRKGSVHTTYTRIRTTARGEAEMLDWLGLIYAFARVYIASLPLP